MRVPLHEKENRALSTSVSFYAGRRWKDRKIGHGLVVCRRSGLPIPIAGRSLRASCPPLARCRLRSAIHGSARRQRRLPGTGSPSLFSPVAQVGNLWLTSVLRSTGFQPVCLSGSHWARARFRNEEQPVGDTRRRRCDSCLAVVAPERWSRELTHQRRVGDLIPAGAEHVSGRLRCHADARYSRASRMSRPSSDRRRRKEQVPRPGLEPGTL